jgi:hypothetical protein
MSDDDLTRIRELMVDCGALAEVETTIDHRIEGALTALDSLNLPPYVSAALGDLARWAAWRDR